MADDLGNGVLQLHSADYRSPADLPAGRVLVVGGGNTGFQIAAELARSHAVDLAVGSRQAPLPQRLLGRDLFRYAEALGLMTKTADSRIGRRMKADETLVGSSPRAARRQGIRMRSRATAATGATVTFADGSDVTIATVVWATGFRFDHSFIELPVFDAGGHLEHTRGVTGSPGLSFVGLPWQHTRGSALLGWVKDDAEFVSRQLDRPG
jgi:putative flavoprotein involved in K+ transport